MAVLSPQSKYLGQLVNGKMCFFSSCAHGFILDLILLLTVLHHPVVPVEESVSPAKSVAAARGFLVSQYDGPTVNPGVFDKG